MASPGLPPQQAKSHESIPGMTGLASPKPTIYLGYILPSCLNRFAVLLHGKAGASPGSPPQQTTFHKSMPGMAGLVCSSKLAPGLQEYLRNIPGAPSVASFPAKPIAAPRFPPQQATFHENMPGMEGLTSRSGEPHGSVSGRRS